MKISLSLQQNVRHVNIRNETQAEAIKRILQPHFKELKYKPLATDRATDNAERNSKWKIIINQEIEPDEW